MNKFRLVAILTTIAYAAFMGSALTMDGATLSGRLAVAGIVTLILVAYVYVVVVDR